MRKSESERDDLTRVLPQRVQQLEPRHRQTSTLERQLERRRICAAPLTPQASRRHLSRGHPPCSTSVKHRKGILFGRLRVLVRECARASTGGGGDLLASVLRARASQRGE